MVEINFLLEYIKNYGLAEAVLHVSLTLNCIINPQYL